jgi:predicted RNase H-like HicB family nuclease
MGLEISPRVSRLSDCTIECVHYEQKGEEKKMKRENEVVYPTFIAEHDGTFLVYVPDMDIYTEGESMVDAVIMARDAIGLKGIDFEDDGKELPDASDYGKATAKAKENAEIFDYSKGILTLVDVNLDSYRKKY